MNHDIPSKHAPIALFVYNRPEHTKRTLRALSENAFADQSHLHVFCDGPKSSEHDQMLVQEVRQVVASEQWCGEVTVITRDENWGLARSIRSGIDSILRQHDRIIVLEDDIETSPGFVRFMNQTLAMYADDARVMNVSGYVPETSYQRWLSETFFVRVMACWGWGTWRRAWKQSRWEGAELLSELERRPGGVAGFNLDGCYPYTEQLRRNLIGEIRTWAVFWAASCYLNDGLSLFPCRSLVRNTGFDGSGENCHNAPGLQPRGPLAEQIPVKKISIRESLLGREYFKAFHRFGSDSRLSVRIRNRFRKTKGQVAQMVPEQMKEPLRHLLGVAHPYGLALSTQRQLQTMNRCDETKVKLFGRDFWIADAASFLGSHDEIFRQGIYEFETSQTTPFIIDAGANIGLASIYFGMRYPGAEIIAIESDGLVCEKLIANLKSFELSNVRVVQGAVWDANSELYFSADGADGGRVSSLGSTMVQGLRLLELFEGRSVDLLKLDVEGAEIRVLSDCESALRSVKRIFVEYHSFANAPQELSKLLSILERTGFRYYIEHTGVHSGRPLVRRETQGGYDLQLNIFATRQHGSN
ncbi:Methyltransferase domain protein [Rosistilla carotiformis]|uniref:Methyltransferase domain protein n=1 Tax=Rosistilla carotiformis TaxID=2528017 RepID=A0A518JVF9_9BACT|nr:FkbM family methyltransferase [Rosistilla carotiformis]QDV69532.1 Methyltransferase domain protein [Rosistilla carotiformis]